MTNSIWNAADRIAEVLKERGVYVDRVCKSENRFGDFSAYIDCVHIIYRVSDHSCNTDYRVDQVDIPVDADHDFFDKRDAFLLEAKARHEKKLADEIAARDAYEAPFKEKFLAAKQHERYDIVIAAYPEGYENKALRKEINQRWLGVQK